MFIWFSGVALLLAAAGGCGRPQRAAFVVVDAPYEQSDWDYRGRPGTRLKTAHYTIYTTLSEPRLLSWLPQTMETAFGYYESLIPPSRKPAARMPVFLFARRGEFEDFTDRTFGRKAKLLKQVRGGGFMERGVTVIEYVSHQTTFPMMTHEGFHQYLYHYATPRVPAWLNEGLAVTCEGQRWGNDGLRAFDPWYNPTRRNQLAEALLRDRLIPLPELLRMNAGHVVGGPRRKINAYYAQVWGLIMFLREGADGAYAADFDRLLGTIGRQDLEMHARAAYVSGSSRRFSFGRELFRAFFIDDLDAVQRQYVAFLRRRFLNEKQPKPVNGE